MMFIVSLEASAAQHGMAKSVTVGDLTISEARGRPVLPNRPAGAYLTIANAGTDDERLLSASSPAFDVIELHESAMTDGVMTMARVREIVVPAGGVAMLAPGGLHLMLFGGSAPFKIGDMYPVTLDFENAGPVEVMIHVQRVKSGHSGHSN